ncbi:MAG TPA: vWA domain-containing protein [Enhygromyxa sp.]|nr:vWA domain-containing protein [Enhygromyxa sp.]
MLRLRYSVMITLLGCCALACTKGDDGNIYGMEGEESPTGITVGDDSTDNAEQTDAPGDGDGQGDGDGDQGDGDGDSGSIKLDTLPDEGADDGIDPEECLEDVDIVFVMDVSTTMGPFFDKLESEISAVHDALSAYDLPNPPHYGLVVFVDDFTLVNAGVPYTDVEELKADFAYWNDFTASNQQTDGGGYNSTWTENSLDALFSAAVGFQWRPKNSTLRMIIHTTDDTFWNGPTVGNGIDILHNYPDTVDILQANEVRMFTFADLIGGQCECDDVSEGFFTEFQGQPPIPAQTGGAAYNIGEVLAGILSLSQAITDSIDDSYCEDYPPVD